MSVIQLCLRRAHAVLEPSGHVRALDCHAFYKTVYRFLHRTATPDPWRRIWELRDVTIDVRSAKRRRGAKNRIKRGQRNTQFARVVCRFVQAPKT